jgi:hypothetical protein
MLVWGDILLHHPELVGELPRDVIILNWGYDAAPDYPQVQVFANAALQQVVCPGTSSWNTLFPRLANARGNIRGFVAAGRRVGTLGVLTTDWGDGGHPNYLGGSWYGFAYGATEAWSPEQLDDAEFEQRFAGLLFGAEAEPGLAAMHALSEACTLPGIDRRNGSLSRQLFFGDPLSERLKAIPDESLTRMRELGLRAAGLLEGMRGANVEAALTLAEFRLAAREIVHAATRARLARQISPNLDEEKRQALYHELSALKRELHLLRHEHERLWLLRNKPDGLRLTMDMFDQAAAVLDALRTQVAPLYRHRQ